MVIDYPFLTTTFTHVHWPIVGEFELASAIAFDLGVFLVVVGSTVLILLQLGKLSKESHLQSEENSSKEGEN
jgi:multicomponent K+:H+ antiporter subunit A